jgi:hypothetical protein
MISKEDLDYLKELDRLRVEARTLRDKGLEAIVDFSLDDDAHWEQQISDNEKVLFRRAKHLAWNLGKIEEYECEHLEHLFFPKIVAKAEVKNDRYEPPVNYPQWPIIELPLVKVEHFIDSAGLCRRFKEASEASDPVSHYIRNQFEGDRSSPLDKYEPDQPPNKGLLNYLVRMLNSALTRPSLYEQVKEKITLSERTASIAEEDPQLGGLVRLNRYLLDEMYAKELAPGPASIELFHMRDDPAPILFAANFLRTRLGNLRGYLDEGTLSCYYRVIRELYNLHNTNWALGAARPGEHSGQPSVFVTTECSRAIGYFARLMENTADFLSRMHETKRYAQHVKIAQDSTDPEIPGLPAAWCTSELECCSVSIKTTIEGSRDYVALLLPNLKEFSDLDVIIQLVEQSVLEFSSKTAESFEAVKEWARIVREAEEGRYKRSRKQKSKEIKKIKLQQMPEIDLTETAHKIAWGALAGALREFRQLSKVAGEENVLHEASKVFAKLAKWLRTHLDPAREYFEKVLHKCLAENARERSPQTVPDLAFSALSVGLITKEWGRRDCRQAIEILCENLDESGQFPEGLPFAYTPKGEGRVVINAQVIRAFAQLAQHLTAEPNAAVVAKIPIIIARMMEYFRSHAVEHEHGIAWPSLGSVNRERASLWISAISVLALHRMVLLLDAHINYGVKRHLNAKTPAELRSEGVPYLYQLMCSDIGYASLSESEDPAPRRVVMELEGMRAYLLGSSRALNALRAKDVLDDLPLRSLILHGPPGTGKTTLAKSLAVTSNANFVEVMSHDLYLPGTERVMEQASLVMDALKLLTSTVILFDEFEPILHARPETPVRITEMLTGNMLPKLDALYKAAGQNGLVYVLATNYVERLDSAAIRAGRFDRMSFIYYADAASRACRLASEFRYLLDRLRRDKVPLPAALDGVDTRLAKVVAISGRCYINRLCSSGWFLAPREIKTAPLRASRSSQSALNDTRVLSPQTEDKLRPVWEFVIWNKSSESIGWDLFASAEKLVKDIDTPEETSKKTEVERDIVKIVKAWDDALYSSVHRDEGFNWDKMIMLLTKPFSIRAALDRRVSHPNSPYLGPERRRSEERRLAAPAH